MNDRFSVFFTATFNGPTQTIAFTYLLNTYSFTGERASPPEFGTATVSTEFIQGGATTSNYYLSISHEKRRNH